MAALGDELLRIVNQLQDLVFNTIGSDSLDLPQIVRRITRLNPESLAIPVPNAYMDFIFRLLLARSPLASRLFSRTSSVVTFCPEAVGSSLAARSFYS